MYRCALGIGAVLLSVLMLTSTLHGQLNAARFIRELDTNGSGHIAPEEIPERSRRLLEKYARYGRLDLRRPNSIGRWEEAIRRYNEQRRSGDRRIVTERESGISEFGRDPGAPLVPGFGLGDIKFPYSKDDLDEADDTLRRYDRNDDGYIDRAEARRSQWTRTDPFESDFNKDNRLSRPELAQRYASRRLLEDGRHRRYSFNRRRDREAEDRSSRSRGSSDRRARYLSDGLMGRYDRNRNRKLESRELRGVGINMRDVDSDQNGELTREELEKWVVQEMERHSDDLTDLLPSWFFELDTNQDSQIQMAEFASEWDDEKLLEFEQLDLNLDGIVTGDELLKSSAVIGGNFANQKAEILMPGATVVSEIEITDDFIIGDLNLQLSITHTYAAQLDGYLIGPDGQRIELFTGVGKDDDHFDKTIFDDEARNIITKSRPPFRGSFRPEAMEKKGQPRLSRYKNKNLKGLWQLMVRANRSDRPGMLHGWSLIVKPVDESSEVDE